MGELRRVLVTGANGLIAGVVRQHLGQEYALSFLAREPAPPPIHVGDIRDLASIRPAFEGMDAVVHLAAASSVDTPWDDVLADNIAGTYNVFEAAREHGVRRVGLRVVEPRHRHVRGGRRHQRIYDLDDDAYVRRVDPGPTRLRSTAPRRCSARRSAGCTRIDTGWTSSACASGRSARTTTRPGPTPADRSQPFPDRSRPRRARHRLRATWLSHRDCARLIQAALDAPVHWAVVYGCRTTLGACGTSGTRATCSGTRPSTLHRCDGARLDTGRELLPASSMSGGGHLPGTVSGSAKSLPFRDAQAHEALDCVIRSCHGNRQRQNAVQ